MKQTVYFEDFNKAFQKTRPNNFSRDALGALYNYFQEIEADTGEEFDLDAIAICCDYTEYKNFQELKSNYLDVNTLEDLRNKTTVIPIDGTQGFIIQNY